MSILILLLVKAQRIYLRISRRVFVILLKALIYLKIEGIESSIINSNLKEDLCSLINHVHSEVCEHPMIIHNGHIDYIVEGQLHHIHDGHCDDHGTVQIVDKFVELQRINQMTGGIDNGIPGY